jgi:peptidyl-prolyl cis-trans isomerase C
VQAYLELKLSWELFKKAPEALSAPERGRLEQVARQQTGIEQRILKSPEAAGVIVPAATLATRLEEIRARYASESDYLADLERIGLDAAGMAAAVGRDLRVEAVLDKVAAAAPEANEVDAEIFYRLHPEAFERPEARRLRHILITFNSPEEQAAARRQLETLRNAARSAEAFGAAAQRHSQCPTAVQGGQLGIVKRGQLFPELEPAAFALAENEVSAVLESPIGLHILRCDQIFAAGKMDFEQVKPRIVEKLTNQRRRQVQREWINALAP